MAFKNPIVYLSQLVADTLIGATIETAASGTRWVMGGTTADLQGYTGDVNESSPAQISLRDFNPGGQLELIITSAVNALTGKFASIKLISTNATTSIQAGADSLSIGGSGGSLGVDSNGTVTIRSATSTSPTDVWIPLPYAANWTDLGAPKQTCAYRLDALGFVHLRGMFKASAAQVAGATLATLPNGFRPAADEVFIMWNNGQTSVASSGLTITAGGVIQIGPAFASGANGTLSGISFQIAGI